MKFRSDSFLEKCLLLMVFLLIVAAMEGCASMSEEYWQERYAELTDEEKEAARLQGDSFYMVCDLTNCVPIFIY